MLGCLSAQTLGMAPDGRQLKPLKGSTSKLINHRRWRET